MKSLLMLPLLILLAVVTCARIAAAEPDDDTVFCEETDRASAPAVDPTFALISYHQPKADDGLLNPFEEPTAPTASPTPNADLPDGYAGQVYDSVKAGRWLVVVGLLLSGLVWGLRKGLGQVWPWVTTDRGGVALVLATSFLGAVANGLAAGRAPGLSDLAAALSVAMAAIGGFVGLKRLIKPPDQASPAKPAPLKVAR